MIDKKKAARIKEIGFSYVGISLDGIGATHDHFRGKAGAFEKAVRAFRNCKAAGQKVGLRLTLSRHNIDDLEGILDFIEREDIERACFYHRPVLQNISSSVLLHLEPLPAHHSLSLTSEGGVRNAG